MISRDQIARRLLTEVRASRDAYENAHRAFQTCTADIPSHLPHPDGTERLITSGKTYRFTMKAYDRAVREYNDFLSSGTVPDWLKDEDKTTVGEA